MENNYKSLTHDAFEEVVEDYIKRDDAVVEETHDVQNALEKFSTLLPVNSKVLDIGSGGGRDSRFLFKKGFEVTGVDFSEKMVEKAKEKQPQINYLMMDFE